MIAPVIFKAYFNPDKWNIGKLLIFTIGILSSISILNWVYNLYFGGNISQIHSLVSFVFITLAVGSIPLTFFVFYLETYLKDKNQTLAHNLNSQLHANNTQPIHTPIKITSGNKNEDLILNLNQLLCVKSEGNYAQIFLLDNEKVLKKVIRSSITNIETQLESHDNIYRCHRSYLVNFENVENITGNARNFNLQISNLDFLVPVSRNFPKSILQSIKE